MQLSGSGRHRFRKQILRKTSIRYQDASGERVVDFDDAYLRSLAKAFEDRAYDQVPFQLADSANTHTNDPERFRGELVGVELTRDGLDGIFEATDEGAKLLSRNPNLGVSCRILENLPLPDGRHFPRAIQHVLGTVNPRLTGMRPWEKLDLSVVDVDEVLDLSEQEEETMPEGDTRTLELPVAQATRLEEFLSDLEAADQFADLMDAEEDPEDAEDDDPTDDDQDEEVETGQALALANSDELLAMQAGYDNMQARVLELTQQLRTNDLRHEVERLRGLGLAPAIIAEAEPLLSLPAGTLELSSPDGSRVDPGTVLRNVLQTVLELAQNGQAVVELDAETGYVMPGITSPEQTRRDNLLKDWDDTYGH